jgi:hypothetical protein
MFMKLFPTYCVDNFYQDPNAIRTFALSQQYFTNESGRYPGKRTKPLHLLDENFFQSFCQKLFSVLFDANTIQNLNWVVSTEFHIIENMSSDKNSIKNKGWIHYDDGSSILAGVIYLNPEPNLDAGTSIFKCIDESVLKNYHENGPWVETKKKFYLEKIDNNYERALTENNNAFVETSRFQNVFNRLVLYDSDLAHGFNTCYSDNDPRLTQVIFVKSLEGYFTPPLTRLKNYLI